MAKFAGVDVEDVKKAKNQREVVEQFVISTIVKESVNGCANDEFMFFMAEWGRFCFEEDNQTGKVLYEIALKRISESAKFKKIIDFKTLLAKEKTKIGFKAYGMPFNDACYSFLVENIDVLLYDMNSQHAKRIAFGILDCIDEDGNVLKYNWDGRDVSFEPLDLRHVIDLYILLIDEADRWKHYANVGGEATYAWVKKYTRNICNVKTDVLVDALASNWRENKSFFKDYYLMIDWKRFFSHINFEKENFDLSGSWLLKRFGLYKFVIKHLIKNEIRK